MESLAGLLRAHPIFASLSPEEINSLSKQATLRDLQPGQPLAWQGDVWSFLFLVGEGELDAVKVSSEGRNLLVTTFKTGELFWGPAFFQDGAPLVATLEANSPARVYLWSRERIEPVFLAHGRLGWELCRLMIQRMQRASAIVDELAFQPVAGRLARLLLDHFTTAGDVSIERNLTLDEMAARVGTTREMVCRVLYRFADKNLINVTRTEFVLNDRDGLRRMVENS
jgi:CRP/FNR family transcriptional regulator, cyclic AMP receptor protein